MGIDLRGFEPRLIKLEFIIYLPKLKVSAQIMGLWGPYLGLSPSFVAKYGPIGPL